MMMHREGNGMRERRSKLVNARDTHSDPGPREERGKHRDDDDGGRGRSERGLGRLDGDVRGHNGQFYDAPAVDGRIWRLGLDPAQAKEVSIHRSQHACMRPGQYSLDVDGLVALEAGERRRSGQGLLDVADDVVPAEHPVLRRGSGR